MSSRITKRKNLSIKEKYQIICDVDKKMKYDLIVSKFQLGNKSTISEIKKKKDVIIEEYEKIGSNKNAKSLKKAKYPNIDEALIIWIKEARKNNITINQEILKVKSIKFANDLGYIDFKGSDGFITKFVKRNGLTFGALSGEANKVDKVMCEDWKNKLQELTFGYSAEDIFNGDELGLFWKLTPNHTYFLPGESRKSINNNKERCTLFMITNSTGSYKHLSIIGKSKNPRCFLKFRNPFKYYSNTSAWMTTDIFNQELKYLDSIFNRENRKIILFVDNCSAHQVNYNLKNIKVEYLPANSTSVLQPLDQGIIWSLKSYFRSNLIKYMITILEDGRDFKTNYNLQVAISLIQKSLSQVSKFTIINCFRKCWFPIEETIPIENPGEETELIWQSAAEKITLKYDTFQEFIEIDNFITTTESINETTIIDKLKFQNEETIEDNFEEDLVSVPTKSEAMNMIFKLKQFYKDDDDIQYLSKLEDKILNQAYNSMKQTIIKDYFK